MHFLFIFIKYILFFNVLVKRKQSTNAVLIGYYDNSAQNVSCVKLNLLNICSEFFFVHNLLQYVEEIKMKNMAKLHKIMLHVGLFCN